MEGICERGEVVVGGGEWVEELFDKVELGGVEELGSSWDGIRDRGCAQLVGAGI